LSMGLGAFLPTTVTVAFFTHRQLVPTAPLFHSLTACVP
jgi:hypothetical protein